MKRTRRLRTSEAIRSLVQEERLNVDDLINPIFVVEGKGIKEEISSLPDVYHFSIDRLDDELNEMMELNIKACIVFGIPDYKDEVGSESFNDEGIVQKAVRYIKDNYPEVYVITDVCMCQYTSHGHCGILDSVGYVKNDETIDYLGKIAVSHARAGADMVAPSDMMDGRVAQIRTALDYEGFINVPIMSYASKFASSYYGPFREAAHSAPSFGDRKQYQMDFHNGREALNEALIDIEEGADMVMVKPALAYMDVVRKISDTVDVPVVVYNVSGEYAMLRMAVANNLMHEDCIYETMIAFKRAGASIIITYFAKYLAKILKEKN